MWSCSLALLDFKKTPCCILSSDTPNLSSCPAPLDFKKTFLLLHPFLWISQLTFRLVGQKGCQHLSKNWAKAKNCKNVLKTVTQVLVRDGQALYRGDCLQFESSRWIGLLQIGHMYIVVRNYLKWPGSSGWAGSYKKGSWVQQNFFCKKRFSLYAQKVRQ